MKLSHAARALSFSLVSASLLGCAAAGNDAGARAPLPAQAAPGAPFAARVAGHGPPMILIPGLGSSGDVWSGTVAHEGDRYTCHTLTLAGFAGQPAIAAPLLSSVREAIAAYIREHHLERPVVVGHSLGGVIALDLAERYPDLVGPLVIVDSLPFLPAARDPEATEEAMKPLADNLRTKIAFGSTDERRRDEQRILPTMIQDPKQIEIALGWWMRSDPDSLGAAVAEVMTTDLRPGLARIHTPALVIGTWIGRARSAADRGPAEQTYRTQYAGLHGAKVILADRARHFVMLDDPRFLHAEMDAFLGAAPPAVPGYSAALPR